jgi:hypothetical protein
MADKSVTFALYQVKELFFSLNSSAIDMHIKPGEELDTRLLINLNIDIKLDKRSKIINLISTVNYVYPVEDKADNLFSFTNSTQFVVNEFEEVSMLNGKDGTLPKGLVRHFAGITFATIRGILVEKLKATKLARYHLPLMSADELIELINNMKKEAEKN